VLGWTAPNGIAMCQGEVVWTHIREPSVAEIIRIGLGMSKSVFQIHGVDASEHPIVRKRLNRREMIRFFETLPPTIVALEACGASPHWAPLLVSFGHEVKLIAPQLAKPYVKRGKNDAADAEALCEAASRPTMRFVPIKTHDQQATLMLVSMRTRLIKRRTQLANAIRCGCRPAVPTPTRSRTNISISPPEHLRFRAIRALLDALPRGGVAVSREINVYITKAGIAAGRRALTARPRGRAADRLDFKIRPISQEWRSIGKALAYKTAVANVCYIWRRPDGLDRVGPMPEHFARAYDLRSCGLLLPRSAPAWAGEDYAIWAEADEAVVATGDHTEVAAWHLMAEIPGDTNPREWDRSVRDFLTRELVGKGAPTAYAVHALRGDGEWLIKPHVHAIVAARHYRRDGL